MRPNAPRDAFRFVNEAGPHSEKCGSPCWLWNGGKNLPPRIPYGRFCLNRKAVYAHVVVYELEIGPVPEGKVLNFDCRRADCVNPYHKTPMAKADSIRLSDSPYGKKFRQTACKSGHPLSGDNLLNRKNGNRGCRYCTLKSVRESARRSRQKRKKHE